MTSNSESTFETGSVVAGHPRPIRSFEVVFGKEDWESRSRVALSLMGLAFALLGSGIAGAFARQESGEAPAT